MQHEDMNAVSETGLVDEVVNVAGTLFEEVTRSAQDIWKKVYAGKTDVTHKALSPLKTLHAKLMGLSFVEPHVAPVADLIISALNRMPKPGVIAGTDLLLLQGLVCLLKDSNALIEQARGLINGVAPDMVLDAMLFSSVPDLGSVNNDGGNVAKLDGEIKAPGIILPIPRPKIPSMGL